MRICCRIRTTRICTNTTPPRNWYRSTRRSAKVTPLGKPGIFEGVEPFDRRQVHADHARASSVLLPAPRPRIPQGSRNLEPGRRDGSQSGERADSRSASRGGGVQPGPRQFRWMPNEPASLMWVEALDGGNPREKVPHRDRVVGSSGAVHRRAHRNRQDRRAFLRHPVRQGFRAGRRSARASRASCGRTKSIPRIPAPKPS